RGWEKTVYKRGGGAGRKREGGGGEGRGGGNPHPARGGPPPQPQGDEVESGVDLSAPTVPAESPPQPRRIGRYGIERVLGRGGFGLVYLAYDERLSRPVAIKVPHPHLVAEASDAEAYLTEARTVAS